MLDNLREGMRIKAIGPGGIFVPDVPADRKLLLISAGSGVTPMMAITTYRWDLGGQPDICFVQCARRPSELVFRRRLEHMATPGAVDQAALRRRAGRSARRLDRLPRPASTS